MSAASSGGGNKPPPREEVEFLYHHGFLPPQVPQADDYRPERDLAFMRTFQESLATLKSCTPSECHDAITLATEMLSSMQKIHENGQIGQQELLDALNSIVSHGTPISLHVRAQNAGVLISKVNCDIHFNAFELLPTNEAAMSTKGRLQRDFPDASISISVKAFQEPGLRRSLASTLSSMTSHVVAGMRPQVRKAGQRHDEDRDTVHPAMVLELLVGVLSAVGQPVASQKISKNTREEVRWDHTRSPWRRSATWLLVRVALQLILTRATGSSLLYKQAMLLFMCRIGDFALRSTFHSDELYWMNAKISQRLMKLGKNVNTPVFQHVQQMTSKTQEELNNRWTAIQRRNSRQLDFSNLSKLDFQADTLVSLPKLDQCIDALEMQQTLEQTARTVKSPALMRFQAGELPCLSGDDYFDKETYALANLHGFEQWVASYCREWSQGRTMKAIPSSTAALLTLIKEYHALGTNYYAGNPEAVSVMLLTIYELWVACDEGVVLLVPLLQEYEPGLNREILQNLLLPLKSQTDRLCRLEEYLQCRFAKAKHAHSKLFFSTEQQDCFAVSYFDNVNSKEQQEILDEILSSAEREKQDKLEEFRQKRQQYTLLMDQHRHSECEYRDVIVDKLNGFTESRHKKNCKKCCYKRTAEAIMIEVHEWPLPVNETKAKAIVFELRLPRPFALWREVTLFLVFKVLGAKESYGRTPRVSYKLSEDQMLRSFSTLKKDTYSCTLLSQDKSNTITHRREKQVSTASETTVCAANGFNYRYYYSGTGSFLNEYSFVEDTARSYTYCLPARSKSLQKYLFRPHSAKDGPSVNSVIAHQSECPPHMTLEEFRELASIPLGHRIQLCNLLLHLCAPTIDFKKDETALIFFQCVNQAGPPGDSGKVLRAAHHFLENDEFASSLLDNIKIALGRVKENWESAHSLCIFSTVAARLLSLTDSPLVQQRCIEILKDIRNVAFGWVALLREGAQQAKADDIRTEMKSKSVDVALICGLTFDVEDPFLAEVLCSASNVSILVQCSISLQEGKRAYSKSTDPVLFLLRHRFRRLLQRTCTILCKAPPGLDDAVRKAWPAYRPGWGWRALQDPNGPWLLTKTANSSHHETLTVHYNILTGELLVNGLPIGRPPKEYETHAQWSLLFGSSPVEVMPTSAPAMEFSMKSKYNGYEVHFGLDSTTSAKNLVVRATKDSSDFTTVPAGVFDGEFPTFFVKEFVHWYNHLDHTVEFRPSLKPWARSSDTMWTLEKCPNGSDWRLTKQESAVVKLTSTTSQVIGKILRPMAKLPRMHILLAPCQSVIEIDIPKLQLGFRLDSTGLLHCREFPGMHVDKDQSLSTLCGFYNKLLLKPREGGRRIVLLAEGKISCERGSEHVKVSVGRSSIVKVHSLQIDQLLGRLVDNGDLQGKLFLAHLHVLTSFCLPDPLTRNTGTEQCLSMLDSAAVKSFGQLEERNIDTLLKIADLTPGRGFYPANEQVMQTVTFSTDTSFMSQHNSLFKAVQTIFRQAEESGIFYPDTTSSSRSIKAIDELLLGRDIIRSSIARVSGSGAEDHSTANDKAYKGRYSDQGTARTSNAYALSAMVYKDVQTRHFTASLPQFLLWSTSVDARIVHGSGRDIKPTSLTYDPQLVASGLDISQWLALHKIIKSKDSGKPNKFDFMIWLATMAASKGVDLSILQIIALMYTTKGVRDVVIPRIETCDPTEGYDITKAQITSIVHSNRKGLSSSPEATLRAVANEDRWTFAGRRDRLFSSNENTSIEVVTEQIWRQWPSRQVLDLDFSNQAVQPSDYINIANVLAAARTKFKMCYNNLLLFKYYTKIQSAISDLAGHTIANPVWPPAVRTSSLQYERSPGFVSVDDVLKIGAPTLTKSGIHLPGLEYAPGTDTDFVRLSGLIEKLELSCASAYETGYLEELQQSLLCLLNRRNAQPFNVRETYTLETLLSYQAACNKRLNTLYDQIVFHIRRSLCDTPGRVVTQTVTKLPRISPTFLLQMLNRHHWPEIGDGWKKCIVEYGLAVAAVQRADRLLKAARSHSQEDLVNEITNSGHSNWDPHEYPESLLLEIESGITIRPVQEDIAAEMRHPSNSKNAVMQLNMGEGKSSVIVPMVATALANSSQLVRVIVAKPQSKQMLQMLVSKLGGLINRRVRQMPLSRSLKLNRAAANSVDALIRDCMAKGDVLLVQPEHILSFRLMVLERSDDSTKQEVGRSLLTTQAFFDRYSRDIVDESDENFSTKFELIYTMGHQRQIEFSPNRWICIQQVLDLARRAGHVIAKELPDCVELIELHRGSFPRFRILKPEASERLVDLIAEHVCEIGIDGFPIARQAKTARDAARRYLVKFDLSEQDIKEVEGSGATSLWESAIAKSSLLLLRGLLAGGILAFVFGQKRWRVNYGLVFTRLPPTKLAVPYRAKDNPTPRSEFSHPDVVIMLTSLSYYYDGLKDEDLFVALEQLMRSDQADVEYAAWIKDAPNMPHEFRQLDGVNTKDRTQCMLKIFPSLRYGKSVIDYFLANVVFPKEMKEFPHKLSASGWDIGMVKAKPTTGFSGTNDSKKLLPLAVEHLDLPRQKHTNALVLHHTLNPNNSVCLMGGVRSTFTSDAERLLDIVVRQSPPIHVILDVGAQILELDNHEVAQRWLEMQPDGRMHAVVFVNNDDYLSVLDRKGNVERFETSSFSSRLDECLVFLDEAHTRGIDLKLPTHYRAAVTLGTNLTKDRLVQACMRMRKLGKGQTVVFCINKEIEGKIRARTSKRSADTIELADVLLWAISETFVETRRAMPLWAVQGERFLKQKHLWIDFHNANSTRSITPSHVQKFLEPEAQSLEHRYRPKLSHNMVNYIKMDEIRERCSEFDNLEFNSSALQEEQERELSPETEQERQVERPTMAHAATPHLHNDVQLFITSGKINSMSSAYKYAFQAFKDTNAAAGFNLSQLDGDEHLLVTADFVRTVDISRNSAHASDVYQRPVQWVLASRPRATGSAPFLMIISPFEAEKLIPDIHMSSNVALHLYKPRCNVNHRSFDRLDFLSVPMGATTQHIPRSLLLQLDIFAGQLYLDSYEDYLGVCKFLGLAADVPQEGQMVAADGFIVKDSNGMKPGVSPVKFLQALMSQIRRNGRAISKTHMGDILEGKLLQRSHFEGGSVGTA